MKMFQLKVKKMKEKLNWVMEKSIQVFKNYNRKMLLCDVYQCSVNNISNLLSYVTVRRHDEEEKKC